MEDQFSQINLVVAWLLTTIGFVSGSLMGLNFKFFDTEWLGGYAGLRRRLFRLGHIAFIGLALINFMFYFTVTTMNTTGQSVEAASWAFIVGGATMPLCCFLLGIYPRMKILFYIPVLSLLAGGFLTTWEVLVK